MMNQTLVTFKNIFSSLIDYTYVFIFWRNYYKEVNRLHTGTVWHNLSTELLHNVNLPSDTNHRSIYSSTRPDK